MRHVLFLLLALAIAACGSRTPAASADIQIYPPDRRQPAPALTGRGLEDEPLALADYSGMPVVVNVWASWCGPCVAEAPQIQAVSQEYAGRAQVLGIAINDVPARAKTFERDLGITYPSFFDPDFRIVAQFKDAVPQAPPTTFVLDARHRVAVRHFSAVTDDELRGYLDMVLGEAGASAPAGGGDQGEAGASAPAGGGDQGEAGASAPAGGGDTG